MKNINKQNIFVYNLYRQYTRKYEDNFKASGYSFSSIWKMKRSLIDHMVRFINAPKLEILDIGCNNGLTGYTLCTSLNKKNIETNIDGIDFVEQAIMIARNNFDYRETFVADITDKDLVDSLIGSRKYQAVISCEVFHYIHPKDYDNFFGTAYSYLAPGGYFIFLLPNVKSIYHSLNKLLYRKFNDYYKYEYDLPLLHSLLRKSNFEVVSICGVDLLTKLKIDLNNYNNRFKRLFSPEFAILSRKK